MIVWAGDGLSIVLAVGNRPEQEELRYPRSELAERYGASAMETTTDPREPTRAPGTTGRARASRALGRAAMVLSGT